MKTTKSTWRFDLLLSRESSHRCVLLQRSLAPLPFSVTSQLCTVCVPMCTVHCRHCIVAPVQCSQEYYFCNVSCHYTGNNWAHCLSQGNYVHWTRCNTLQGTVCTTLGPQRPECCWPMRFLPGSEVAAAACDRTVSGLSTSLAPCEAVTWKQHAGMAVSKDGSHKGLRLMY